MLTAMDSVFVLDTCGIATGLPARHPNFGIMNIRSPSGASIDFENVFVSGSGGDYRLCWCGANFSCSRPMDYKVDIGGLLVIGVTPLLQDRTCALARRANLMELLGST
jgi:hypothetical protein